MIASIAPPLAHAHAGHGHAGHLVTLLYLAPILIGIALVAVQSVRDRRRGIQPAARPDSPYPLGDPLER